MPYRLKSRTQSPPNGFLYRQALTGWENFKVCPSSQWDFQLLCNELQKHRLANPKYRLITDMTAIQNEVDAKNAERVAAIPGGELYVVSTDVPASFHQAPIRSSPVLAAVKAISVGAKTILDFEDSGESPVAYGQALERAQVCVSCPQNELGDLSRFFTIPASERIRKQLERAHEMKLTTPVDTQLNVCGACLCPLKLKVWFPLKFIAAHMSEDVKVKLDSKCWILKEAANESTKTQNLEN
jgi:hypothetical protein